MATYRVQDGKRVVVAGIAYSNGDTFTAEPEHAQPMVEAGWVTEVGAKAVHGEQVEDKAIPRTRTPRQRN